MEQTGWIEKLTRKISRDWEAYSLQERSSVVVEYRQGLESTLELLKEIEQISDVTLILLTEKVILRNDLYFYANSIEMRNSLMAGLEDLAVAQNALKTLQNPDDYRIVKATMSKKDMARGLPLDGFRKFERSHQTRLSNLLKTLLSTEEKSLIRQRKNNLQAARESYIKMQQNALGIRGKTEE